MTPFETNTAIDLSYIRHLQEKPQPFEPGEPLFWTDPHIARQMLASHLDPSTDGASLWGDQTGTPYTPASEWTVIAARKSA